MWTSELFGFTFFQLFYYFMLYSFLGWAMESAFVSITTKEWVNRGFINGPLCPIYGTGALLILVLLSPVQENLLLLFCGGFLVATVVEYAIAVLLEKLFQDIRKENAIVMETYEQSFMTQDHIQAVLQCYRHRLGLL